MVTEQVELLGRVVVHRSEQPGVGLVGSLKTAGQVVDGVRDFSVGVNGVENLVGFAGAGHRFVGGRVALEGQGVVLCPLAGASR